MRNENFPGLASIYEHDKVDKVLSDYVLLLGEEIGGA
jgi:hypothetical protein